MRGVKMWFWDRMYRILRDDARLGPACIAHYMKAKYGAYPVWYGKDK